MTLNLTRETGRRPPQIARNIVSALSFVKADWAVQYEQENDFKSDIYGGIADSSHGATTGFRPNADVGR
ncbi:MAG: hypothetical protein JJ926_13550 [Roseitalea sp.]|jgi:hypothetical protein|uniref:hypothetical protein n=1 Tax=Oceaniradius stylonematis TaxID=2184161 RepID=UPI000D6D8C50|nr:hypothetical protein [Oceaniradius stylonematis]MBO6554188.1 hypothetical protein [Roseitalea sp.]MBO6953232.1 hypothetical protein [Rhizobiaceae bacterium]MBO6593579.1 hypothetical protein [Roseitalea sp.]MBO6600975.1 hypothetical protein [Roseitalea sp.]MBO6612656.1 hypothetical protein [Roseitalea sp.]